MGYGTLPWNFGVPDKDKQDKRSKEGWTAITNPNSALAERVESQNRQELAAQAAKIAASKAEKDALWNRLVAEANAAGKEEFYWPDAGGPEGTPNTLVPRGVKPAEVAAPLRPDTTDEIIPWKTPPTKGEQFDKDWEENAPKFTEAVRRNGGLTFTNDAGENETPVAGEDAIAEWRAKETEANKSGPFATRKGPGGFSPSAAIPDVTGDMKNYTASLKAQAPGVQEVMRQQREEYEAGLEAEAKRRLVGGQAAVFETKSMPGWAAAEEAMGEIKGVNEEHRRQLQIELKNMEPEIESKAIRDALIVVKSQNKRNRKFLRLSETEMMKTPEFMERLKQARAMAYADAETLASQKINERRSPSSFMRSQGYIPSSARQE